MKILIQKSIIITSLLTAAIPVLSHANNYNGTYAGVDLGPVWFESSYQTNAGCVPQPGNAVFCNSSPDPSSVNGTAVANSGTGNFNARHMNFDLHVGHNWQIQNYMVGGEAEFGGWNISQARDANGAFPLVFLGNRYSLYDSISSTWLATLRARLGVVVKEKFLLYATGGAAFTKFDMTASYSDNAIGIGFPGGIGSNSRASFNTGWILGAGGEWRLTDLYSIKIEYMYLKFGDLHLVIPVSNTPAFQQTMQASANIKTQLLRVGLNYNF
jgi:outer membrane immunogenic protein